MANSKIEINDKGMDRIFSKNTGPTSHPASRSRAKLASVRVYDEVSSFNFFQQNYYHVVVQRVVPSTIVCTVLEYRRREFLVVQVHSVQVKEAREMRSRMLCQNEAGEFGSHLTVKLNLTVYLDSSEFEVVTTNLTIGLSILVLSTLAISHKILCSPLTHSVYQSPCATILSQVC